MSPKILLFGAGAIGTCYIHILQQAGCEVTAVCRSNYEAAKANGFHLDSQKYGNNLHIHPNVVRSTEEAASETFDYIIVCAKSCPGSSPSTAELLKPVVSKDTTIVLIQNGIGIEDEYAAAYPHNTLLSTVVYLPATQTSPGHISMANFEYLEIGTFPAKGPRESAEKLRELIRKGNGTADVFEDVQVKRWGKLMVNAGWNPVCALARTRDVGVLEASAEAVSYVKGIMMEVVGVARAMGYEEIDEQMADKMLARATDRKGTKGVEPSMMSDALNGRRMEVEAIIGNAMRMGRGKGVKVERLEGLYVLTKALDASFAAARGEKV